MIGLQLVVGLPSATAPLGVPNALWSPKSVEGTSRATSAARRYQQQFRGTGRIAVYFHTGTRFSAFSGAFPAPASSMFNLSDITGSDSCRVRRRPARRYWRALRLYDHAAAALRPHRPRRT